MTTLRPLMIYPATLPLVVLRNSTFRKRFIARRGGDAIDLSGLGTVIDCDIKDVNGIRIGRFTPQLVGVGSPILGMFDIKLTPEQSIALPVAKSHKYDLSITIDGDRYYYVQGPLEVRETQSRSI